MGTIARIKGAVGSLRSGNYHPRTSLPPVPHLDAYVSSATQRMDPCVPQFIFDPGAEMELVKLYPNHLMQRVLGFGAALTEASAHTFQLLPEPVQHQVLDCAFGSQGNAYNLARVPVQSCDFSLGNYSYVSHKRDVDLRGFTLERDERESFPFYRAVLAVQPSLEFFASPWSPPAFMKTNRSMNFGGRLRPKYYERWAQVLTRYVSEMRERGFFVSRLSLQNEPNAAQLWDSCLFSAEEERIFGVDYLRPALDAAGLEDVRIFFWDHNKERILDRAQETLRDDEALAAFGGVAFHWYAGDHFEALRQVCTLFPDKEFIHTEGCVEYSRGRGVSQVEAAEQYAHDIIGDFCAGANAYLDWNVLLDAQGGPNHVGNYCDAPLMATADYSAVQVHLSHTYIGHFSRFVTPGARVCLVSRAFDTVEAVGFVNPDQQRVLVLLNRRDTAKTIRVCEAEFTGKVELDAHSIMTLTWYPPISEEVL